MKVISEGKGDWVQWWIGMRIECAECGRTIELEKKDQDDPYFCRATSGEQVGWSCRRCGFTTYIERPANADVRRGG